MPGRIPKKNKKKSRDAPLHNHKDESGNEQIRYFDYVTADKDGEALADRNKTTKYEWWDGLWYQSEKTPYRDDATKVQYIHIVELEKDENGKFNTKHYTLREYIDIKFKK